MRRALLLLVSLLLSCMLARVSGVVLRHDTQPYPPGEGGIRGLFPHSMALFGPDPASRGYNRTGQVVWLEDNLSLCKPLASADRAHVAGKIILAKREPADPDRPCTFQARGEAAQDAGAMGLIIGDSLGSNTFTSAFMGPYDLNAVEIPVIMVLKNAWEEIHRRGQNPGSTAMLNEQGLIYGLDYYQDTEYAQERYGKIIKILIVAMPLIVAVYSWYFWWQTHTPPSPVQQQPQQQQQQPQQQQQQQAVAAAPADVSVAIHDPDNIAPRRGVEQPSQFGEHDMAQISLPVPPHLSSGDTAPDGSNPVSDSGSGGASGGHDSVEVSLNSPPGGSSSSSGRGRRSLSVDESEGALLGGRHHAISSDAVDVESLSPAVGGAGGAPHHRAGLARPLLPILSVPAHQKAYYTLLKGVSQLGKPAWILRLNVLVLSVHALCAAVVLVTGWDEVCPNSNQSMVSLWLARALIGIRICYWQTHSSRGASRPLCLDIFFKNWADCIYLFTGTLSSFTDDQRNACMINAPITYRWVEIWTLSIYVTYGVRIVLWALDRLSTRYSDKVPHLVSIGARSLLSVSQGGFSCAGPLDANQPATQLDLMLIPTVSFAEGMYPPDDAVCGVCLGEYAAGEELRVLNCSHHFHKR
jgi:hypothetical protein